MLVKDLMTTDVVTTPLSATLQEAAGRLLDGDVGSLIVVDAEGSPVGILTETDILRAAHRSQRPFTQLGVSEVGHRAVVTTDPDASVSLIAERMADNDVKKVPVLESLDIVGIITLTDIVWHLSDIRTEASELERAREKWDPTR